MVKCGKAHIFANTPFNKIEEKDIGLSIGENICCSTLFNFNQMTMIVLATQHRVIFYELPSFAELPDLP